MSFEVTDAPEYAAMLLSKISFSASAQSLFNTVGASENKSSLPFLSNSLNAIIFDRIFSPECFSLFSHETENSQSDG